MSVDALLKNWTIEFSSGIPVYKQIMNRLKTAMADGSLKDGDRLPTIRELHQALNVNPNTVAKAYSELELKGLLIGQRGSGSYARIDDSINTLPPEAKRTRLTEIYNRMLSEARGFGVNEQEVIAFIKKKTI